MAHAFRTGTEQECTLCVTFDPFANLTRHELQSVARLFKERRFPKGERVVKEGSGGAAFFVVESGEATV